MNNEEGNPELSSAEVGAARIDGDPNDILSNAIETNTNTLPLEAGNVPATGNAPEGLSTAQQGKPTELEPDFHRLDPKNIRVEMIAGSIASGVMSLGGVIGTVVAYFAVEAPWVWWLILGIVVLLCLWLWVLTLIWPGIEYKYTSWKLDELGLEIRRGVLWRHRITVPRARVQHVDVSQGPLQRNFGLAKLTVYTAGTQNSSVELEGVVHPVALAARDNLISKNERDPQHVV